MLGAGLLIALLTILRINQTRFGNRPLIGSLLILLVGLELFLHIPREGSRRFHSFPAVPYIEFIKTLPERARVYGLYWALHPNTASGYQVDDLGIFISLLPSRYTEYINAFIIPGYFQKDNNTCSLQSYPLPSATEFQPFRDMLNVAFFVGPRGAASHLRELKNSQTPQDPDYAREVELIPNNSAFPRAYVVHRAFFEPENKKLFAKTFFLREQLRQVVIIQESEDERIQKILQTVPPQDGSVVKINKYTANEVILHAQMEHPGFIVLGDTFHPDWQAFIDGKKTRIYFTNGLIRSVFVPEGTHTIRYVFKPWSFYLGLGISGLTLLIWCGIWIGRNEAPG